MENKQVKKLLSKKISSSSYGPLQIRHMDILSNGNLDHFLFHVRSEVVHCRQGTWISKVLESWISSFFKLDVRSISPVVVEIGGSLFGFYCSMMITASPSLRNIYWTQC